MIEIKHDIEIDIATAHSRLAKKWKNRRWKWSELLTRCEETTRTAETAQEYAKMSREEQSNIKDVGGFVGGYLSGGTRKNANVMYRSVATLDIDYGNADVWDDFTMAYGFAAMLYSTHKHTEDKPRFRLVFPLNRKVKPSEYEPLCRKIAAEIGIDLFDDTTYELPRLFYWPSTSKDAPYVFHVQDGKPCDVDEILQGYINYRNVSEWPMSGREQKVITHAMKKAGEPTEKPGLIGAFCRAYSIEDAIDVFLSEKYEKTALDSRYTYKLGSVAGGLVCYEGKFAYSHHETDPASRQLCNAFDLVRLHLYGVLDEDSKIEDVTKRPSYLKMQELAAADKKVRSLLTRERRESLSDDFDGIADVGEETPDDTWMENLEYAKSGSIKPTSHNILEILENDPKLKGHLWHDLFSGFDLIVGGLPWNQKASMWGNRDDANLRIYLDEHYGITGKDKIKDAKDAILTRHSKHPIREYLNGLEWDGIERLDRLIIDYIGAEDTPLNRTMTRKHFTAAVARVMTPGCKYDYCLILQGKEGIGKSTLLNTMGGAWFNDSLITMEGKTGMEQLRCGWIIELAELSGIKRSEVEQVKSYISRRDDIYRAAYGTTVERHPRQCVFCGTTNEDYFLKGDTGNRRFWVISVNAALRTKTMDELADNRDQIWAEAVHRWRKGEKLYMNKESEDAANERQKIYNDNADDPTPGMLESFLEMKLPVDWDSWDLNRRRAYISNPDPLDEVGSVQRNVMCAAEFVCERLGQSMKDKDYKYVTRKINALMRDMDGWAEVSLTRNAEKLYGRQRGFKRINED